MNDSTLRHHGVKGMHWGTHKNTVKKTSTHVKSKEERVARNKKIVKVGASVTAGVLSSGFAAKGLFALTGNATVATVLAPSLGVLGGMKYYEWINS